jgi:hypothetical protein
MAKKVAGYLEVGISDDGREIIVNHPDLRPDVNGVGHIVFSPNQARSLAKLLSGKADEIEKLYSMPAVSQESIDEAKSHLRVALIQVLPSDDKIIVEHMVQAYLALGGGLNDFLSERIFVSTGGEIVK